MKLFYTISALLTLSLFLISCGGSEDQNQGEDTKKTFYISTQKFGDFPQEAKIKKIGKITGSQDIDMTASVSGRVLNVLVKAGDDVQAGQHMITLSDNLTNYGVALSRSENNLQRAQINYDSQKIALDKQVGDAEVNVEKLEKNLAALLQTNQQNIARAQNDVDALNLEKDGSQASLDLAKLDQNIAKLELDYQNLLISDQQTLDGLQANFSNHFNSYTTLLADIVEYGDELFGISEFNRRADDDFDTFLGAGDLSQRTSSRTLVAELMKVSDSQDYIALSDALTATDMENQAILDGVIYLSDRYDEIETVLESLETTLNNSLVNATTFSETTIQSLIAEANGYQTQYQANQASLVSFETSTKTFLNTYQSAQLSTLKQIDVTRTDRDILIESLSTNVDNARIAFENTVISQADQVNNLEAQLENARSALENARQNREVSLRSASNAIQDAQIGYRESNQNYEKLVVRAPVSGTIGDVFIDVGQEVYSGNTLLSLVSNGQKEISLSFSKDEIAYLAVGDEVFLESGSQKYNGTLLSLASVSDRNLNYKATIGFDASVSVPGDLVEVYALAQTQNILLPVNMVEVIQPGIGFIKTLSGSTLQNTQVDLGRIWNDEIEILTPLDAGKDVVINNVSNYDPNKFTLEVQNNIQ